MTRFNTGNPIGSADPRDRDDNSKNLDEAVNDLNAETWIDRFGVERLTIQGALNRFNDVIIAGGQIFESEESGRDAVQDGQYYYVVSDDPDVSRELWRRISETESELIAEDPSAEGLRGAIITANTAIELASQPTRAHLRFHPGPATPPVKTIRADSGQAIAVWDEHGRMLKAVRTRFHPAPGYPVYAKTDRNGVAIFAIDGAGQLIKPSRTRFHPGPGYPAYAWTDINGVVFYGIDANGVNVIGGGGEGIDVAALPIVSSGLEPNELYKNNNVIESSREYSPLYDAPQDDAFKDTAGLYGYFDSLVSEFPDYVERSTLGSDSVGNPIYAYTFTPPGIENLRDWSEADVEPPLAVLVNGIHGSERTGGYPIILFAQELCRRWQVDGDMFDWRFGCKFVMVPTINPGGLDNSPSPSRKNPNGVDLNRNFPYNWEDGGSTNPDSNTYRGPSAGSEAETQIAMSLPDLYPNAFVFFDFHSHAQLASRGYASWIGANNEYCLQLTKRSTARMTGFLKREYSVIPQDNVPLNRVTASTNGSMAGYWAVEKGVNGMLFESVTNLGSVRREAIEYNFTSFKSLFKEFYDAQYWSLVANATTTPIQT